jgi:hypothetical protein
MPRQPPRDAHTAKNRSTGAVAHSDKQTANPVAKSATIQHDRSAGHASLFLFFRINFWTFQLFGRKILNSDSETPAMRGAANNDFSLFQRIDP